MPLQIIIIVNNIYIYVDFLFSAKLIRLLVCGTPGELLSHKGKHDYDPEHENTESDFGLIFHCNLARGPVIVTDELSPTPTLHSTPLDYHRARGWAPGVIRRLPTS